VDPEVLLGRLRAGEVRNVRFKDIRRLAEALGFRLQRVRGSHHIFTHPQTREAINLQRVGKEAKPYQIRQLLELVERYSLTLEGK
jgi:predicted RNA binding protein YcfA (HicA-like mRNA interferase family)